MKRAKRSKCDTGNHVIISGGIWKHAVTRKEKHLAPIWFNRHTLHASVNIEFASLLPNHATSFIQLPPSTKPRHIFHNITWSSKVPPGCTHTACVKVSIFNYSYMWIFDSILQKSAQLFKGAQDLHLLKQHWNTHLSPQACVLNCMESLAGRKQYENSARAVPH